MKRLFVNETEVEPQEVQARLEQMVQFYAMRGVPQEAIKEHLNEFVAAAQEQVIGSKLIAAAAQEKGLSEEALVEDVVKDVPAPSDADVEKYYNENTEAFKAPEEVKASHVLVKTEGMDDDAKAKARAKIDGILARIRGEINVDAAFAQAAREHSDCPSGQEGGDLGWFGHGMMVPEFDKAAFEMKDGALSDVIETQFGYHILLKTGSRGGGQRSFEECRDAIREALAGQAKSAALDGYVASLRAKAKVEVRES